MYEPRSARYVTCNQATYSMAPRSPPWKSRYSHRSPASYLADLRTNRPARPSGSRPLPSKPLPTPNENIPPRAESALSFRTVEIRNEAATATREQKLTHRASLPTADSFGSLSSQKGRPLVPSPSAANSIGRRKVSPPQEVVYKESTSRLREKEEAHALRKVLEKIDHDDDEERIHNAAKQEAADLVWKHINPSLAEVEKTAAYRNPDLNKQKYGELGSVKKAVATAPIESKQQSRSSSAESSASTDSKKHRLPWLRRKPKIESSSPVKNVEKPQKSVESETVLQKGVRKISGKRQASSGSSKANSRNPEVEIYEEPEDLPSVAEVTPKHEMPLQTKERNSLPRGSRPLPEKSHTDSVVETRRQNRIDIWKNGPTQSRNAAYTASRALPQTPMKTAEEPEVDEAPRYKDGYEIRSDDIRAATSMRKSDRSPNLPTPTAVSDRLGRPIVSFDPKWKPGTESPRTSQDMQRLQTRKEDGSMAYPVKPSPPVPEITIMEDPNSPALKKEAAQSISTMVVPTIGVSAPDSVDATPAVPQIMLSCDDPMVSKPSITVESERPKARPLPAINAPVSGTRPLPNHTQSSPSRLPTSRPVRPEIASRVPWLARTPTSASASSVTCTACSLPIAGRIVTASGAGATSQKARFHPECFTCHHCSTALECVSFYPEPENARAERYQAEMSHLSPEELHSLIASNEDLRFFCHLDYHELYSPRCYTCKTPVEGAVVLALGRYYHQDHFFCAECGDPFTSESPFVEHNSYPYCVSCHTRRTSARCRACKSPILNEMTVEALGGKWHEACFVCCECGGDFGEEGRFFVREIEVELTNKEKRKGFGSKIEEQAACQTCEERRVKNVNIFL